MFKFVVVLSLFAVPDWEEEDLAVPSLDDDEEVEELLLLLLLPW